MALSQVQCLDDHHVNPRTHESKAEFFYCEDQRLALELLLRDGREAFVGFLEARGLRGFLSDPELDALLDAAEPYDPGAELFPEDAEDGAPPLSLHYWPALSDTSVPQMDLGWPDCESYRGVTRTSVYTQPPLDGQAHVKEVVRKMIAQAQKVIAVVMDVFTDVDIFRDLLDAGFRRRVSVYVLLERTALPHFLSMCRRANMHAGHLKNLRVRCTEGTEFYTRSCTKVKGRLGHRFMFVDGDKAVSGSYSFTWMSSRLDRTLITVVTGQAVDAFDRLFRILWVTSSSADLRQVATAPEPEPEPLPQPVAVVLPSAALARKMHNPKYALVAVANPPPAAEQSCPKEPEKPDVPESKKRRQNRASQALQEEPPLHPGLTDLKKAYLIDYLPTWPEPDPPSDVIGFINVRDASRPAQVHLQRSEMFERSNAIRFSSPISMKPEVLPEVATPRRVAARPAHVLKPGGSEVAAPLVDGGQPAPNSSQPADQAGSANGREAEHDAGPPQNPQSRGSSSRTDTVAAPEHRPGPGTGLEAGSELNTEAAPPPAKPHTERVSMETTPSLQSTTSLTTSTLHPPVTGSFPTSVSSPPTSAPPVPKPRTVQLVFTHGGAGGGRDPPGVSLVRKPESVETTDLEKTNGGSDVADGVQAVPERPEPHNSTTTAAQRHEEAGGVRRARSGVLVDETEPREEPESREKTQTGPEAGPDTNNEMQQNGNDVRAAQRETLPSHNRGFTPPTLKNAAEQEKVLTSTPTDPSIHPHPTAPEVQPSPEPRGGSHTPERLRLRLTDTHTRDLRSLTALSPTPEGAPPRMPTPDPRTPTPDPRTPTPDPRSPTPDPRTPTPDPRAFTPDLRSPTPDVSDGYVSPGADSVLSTTSDEFYECRDSPSQDALGFCNHSPPSAQEQTVVMEPKEETVAVKVEVEKERNEPERRTEQDSRGSGSNGSEETEEMDKDRDPEPQGKETPNTGATVGPAAAERPDPRPAVAPRGPQTSGAADGQQNPGVASSSQPPRPPRPIAASRPLGTRPCGSHQLQVGGMAPPVGSHASSYRRPSTRTPSLGAVGGSAEQRSAKVVAQKNLPSQGRTRVAPSQNPLRKTQSAQEEGTSPFSITFARLYRLKGLKDKMNKLPAQSRRGASSSPGQRRKSSS